MDESRLVLIPSAVDPLVAAGPAVGLRTQLGLSESGQLAVNLGALTPEKGQSTLITAAQQLVRDLPDLHWLIVGEGAMEKTLQQQIAKLGLSDRVHLLTQLKDPHRVLAEADIFVLSSTSEGLGSSVLAAMAQGVPVVATRVGGVPELLQSGGGLLVEPEDSGALAGAVRRVLGDPELRENLTRKAREELGKFSADAMAVQVLSVYRSCAHTLGGS